MKKSRSRNRSRSRTRRRSRTRSRSRTRMRGGRKSRTRRRNRSRNRKHSRTHTRRRNRTRNRRRKRGGLYDKFTPLKRRDASDFQQAEAAYGMGPHQRNKIMTDFKRESNIAEHVTMKKNPGLRKQVQAARRKHADANPNDLQTSESTGKIMLANN